MLPKSQPSEPAQAPNPMEDDTNRRYSLPLWGAMLIGFSLAFWFLQHINSHQFIQLNLLILVITSLWARISWLQQPISTALILLYYTGFYSMQGYSLVVLVTLLPWEKWRGSLYWSPAKFQAIDWDLATYQANLSGALVGFQTAIDRDFAIYQADLYWAFAMFLAALYWESVRSDPWSYWSATVFPNLLCWALVKAQPWLYWVFVRLLCLLRLAFKKLWTGILLSFAFIVSLDRTWAILLGVSCISA